jgi:hypothetical protein
MVETSPFILIKSLLHVYKITIKYSHIINGDYSFSVTVGT